MSTKIKNFLAFSLLFIQPIFMASNLIVARGGVEYVPPISLAFWRWTLVFLILLPFNLVESEKHYIMWLWPVLSLFSKAFFFEEKDPALVRYTVYTVVTISLIDYFRKLTSKPLSSL